MTVKLSVITPVLNECPWIGYSILAAMPFVHEFIYALDEKSSDGTRELLHHVKEKYAHEKLVILDHPTFDPTDLPKYNQSFNRCIEKMTGDAAWFLHADMIVTDGPKDGVPVDAMAWWTRMTSYAGDLKTVISKGRCNRWKNIHAKKMGLHYYGGYGSQNEDFYHAEITGKAYKHYGLEFSKYPFQVLDSGIAVNHYCENKDYKRRLEKMMTCLSTMYPHCSKDKIYELAVQHPRVTLDSSSLQFGVFELKEFDQPIPEVFEKYKEFDQFVKSPKPIEEVLCSPLR